MNFQTYISDTSRRRHLATLTGNSPDYLWQVGTGRRQASANLAKAIEKATMGVIGREQLRPDIWGDKAA